MIGSLTRKEIMAYSSIAMDNWQTFMKTDPNLTPAEKTHSEGLRIQTKEPGEKWPRKDHCNPVSENKGKRLGR